MARSRPHFKVHTTILHHDKMSGVVCDNELFGLYVKLGVLAIERYASRNANTFTVSHSELLGLTNRKRIDKALLVLSKLIDNSPLTIAYQTHNVSITFPNLLEKQGFHPNKVQESATSYTNTNTKTYTYNDRDNDSVNLISDSEIQTMIEVRPGGARYEEREVRAWVEWITPQIALRGPKDPKRMLMSWWPNARRKAVDEALAWCATSKEYEVGKVEAVDVSEVPASMFKNLEEGIF